MMEIVPRLEKRTHYIATFANVITLVGLLGTIIGLIKGFTAVAQVNPAEKAEMLSASISIAMNNTAFALMVAIPFLLIHSFLQAQDQRDRRRPRGREDQLPEPGAARQVPTPRRRRADRRSTAEASTAMRVRRLRKEAAAPRGHRVHQPDRGAGAVPAVDRGVHAAGGDRPDACPRNRTTSSSSSKANDLKLEIVIRPDASRSATASAA